MDLDRTLAPSEVVGQLREVEEAGYDGRRLDSPQVATVGRVPLGGKALTVSSPSPAQRGTIFPSLAVTVSTPFEKVAKAASDFAGASAATISPTVRPTSPQRVDPRNPNPIAAIDTRVPNAA